MIITSPLLPPPELNVLRTNPADILILFNNTGIINISVGRFPIKSRIRTRGVCPYYYPGRAVLDVPVGTHAGASQPTYTASRAIGSFDYNVNVWPSSGVMLICFLRRRNSISPHYIIPLRSLRLFFIILYLRIYQRSKALSERRVRIKYMMQTVRYCVSGLKSSVQSVPSPRPYSIAIVNSYRLPRCCSVVRRRRRRRKDTVIPSENLPRWHFYSINLYYYYYLLSFGFPIFFFFFSEHVLAYINLYTILIVFVCRSAKIYA